MSENPLGQATAMPDTYAPDVLYAISRAEARQALGLVASLPFTGCDIWNAWELTWLHANGRPAVACCEIRVPADSPNLVESKSLKLYLNSFAMSRFADPSAVAGRIRDDLGRVTGAPVAVELLPVGPEKSAVPSLPGDCIDELPIDCATWEVDPALLSATGPAVEQQLHSHLLRSLCPVTGQPDVGSVLVGIRGPRLSPESLLRYIVSFRRHQDFHEACVERMFRDIMERCRPASLTVYARYLRRGGIDINPYRSTETLPPQNLRLWRQ